MMDFAGLKQMVASSPNIVFFGGAGVSTESNIPDFRSTAGLYQTKSESAYPPEVMLSRRFFMEHTEEFFDFYKRKMIYKDALPNRAHLALSHALKKPTYSSSEGPRLL
jgi:NAD-dependent deacetylase